MKINLSIIILFFYSNLIGQIDSNNFEIELTDSLKKEYCIKQNLRPSEYLSISLNGIYYITNIENFKCGFELDKSLVENKKYLFRIDFIDKGVCNIEQFSILNESNTDSVIIEKIRYKREGNNYNLRFQGFYNNGVKFDYDALYRVKKTESGYYLELRSVFMDK